VRTAHRFAADPASPRLWRRQVGDRVELWTEPVGELPAVYGERWTEFDGHPLRTFEPARSKLAAGIHGGWSGPLPRAGERWLYLGAASGTTASHVADLVGPGGDVFAVERSLRPFARLDRLAARWRNLGPVLGDARTPDAYADLVPPVDGIYADIAQPDQVAIVRRNVELLARAAGAAVLIALKTPSMGRERTAPRHRERAEVELAEFVDLAPAVRLDPFQRAHYLVGGTWSPGGGGRAAPVIRPRPGTRRGPRRP